MRSGKRLYLRWRPVWHIVKMEVCTEAKAVLDEHGIRCRIQTGTNVETGEHDYNVLTSDEDAREAADILKKIYNGNSGYECYEY